MGDWAGDHQYGWAAQLHRWSAGPNKVRRRKKVSCSLCGAEMNRKNLRKHVDRFHPKEVLCSANKVGST